MSPELASVLADVMQEIEPRFGRDYTAEQAKQHLVDRWYRFTAFGVEGRADMRKTSVVKTTHSRKRRLGPDEIFGAELTVAVEGTPLEGK